MGGKNIDECECCKWDDMGYIHEPFCTLREECECEKFLNKRVNELENERLPISLFRYVKTVDEKDILGSIEDSFNKRYSIELYECIKCKKKYEIGHSYYVSN